MENFFYRNLELLKRINKFQFYSNGSYIKSKTLYFDKLEIYLGFETVYFNNLTYDFFIISEDQNLYRINKYKKKIDNFGSITDKILSVECGSEGIVIVTEKEIMVFNVYFDLVKSIFFEAETYWSLKENSTSKLSLNTEKNKCPINHEKDKIECLCEKTSQINLNENRSEASTLNTNSIILGDELFAYLTPYGMYVFDFDLEYLGYSAEKVKSAVYISRYNKFACAIGVMIKFIEPNGLEHGDPLLDDMDKLALLNVDNCTLLIGYKNNMITGFFMKNFFWYKKFTFDGEFFGIHKNCILFEKNDALYRYFMYREISQNFVIDGSKLYYTNLKKAIIPCPFYYKKIECSSQILSFYLNNNILYIMEKDKILKYNIDERDIITFIETIPLIDFELTNVCGCTADQSLILINTGNEIRKIGIYNQSSVLFLEQVKDIMSVFPEVAITRLYNFDGISACLFSNGIFLYNHKYQLDFDTNSSFDIQISEDKSKIYFLNAKKLYTAEISSYSCKNPILSIFHNSINSFLLYKNYLLFATPEELIVQNLQSQEKSGSYVDNFTEILLVNNNKIILYTRFGTFETITNKIFSKCCVRDLIKNNKFSDACNLCDQNHVNYLIFFENDGFNLRNLSHFNEYQSLSLLSSIVFQNATFILENEYFDRLALNFDPVDAMSDLKYKEKRIFCVKISSINHLCKDMEKIPIKTIKNFEQFLSEDLLPEYMDVVNYEIDDLHLINAFLKNLDLEKHFSAIVNVFISFKRIELAFFLPNLKNVVKILLTKLSPETVAKESLKTFDIDIITTVHRICQKDVSSFMTFYNSCENIRFSLSDYLEDRKSALFYLVSSHLNNVSYNEDKIPTEITEYALKHKLLNDLLMYTYYNIFNYNFYEFVAAYKEPLEAFYLYYNSGNIDKALDFAKQNLFWREALHINSSIEYCNYFVEVLSNNHKYAEAGEIFENYLNNYDEAINCYLNGKKVLKTFEIYISNKLQTKTIEEKSSIEVHIKRAAVNFLKNDIIIFREILESFEKYKDRLGKVRQRLNDNIADSQTSFSYTSAKSSQRALTKDRPGGIFENEYVLNKIREKIVLMVNLRAEIEEFLIVKNMILLRCLMNYLIH